MVEKSRGDEEAFPSKDTDPFDAYTRNQYAWSANARIRREYMDLAPGSFYGTALEIANKPLGGTVLDVGCGDGEDLVQLALLGHTGRLMGLEVPLEDGIVEAEDRFYFLQEKAKKEGVTNIETVLGYAEDIPLPSGSVDVVILANVLQHAKDKDAALTEITRVLKAGGKLIIISNDEDNKPLHHEILDDRAQRLGGVSPGPLSASFTTQIAKSIMGRHRAYKPLAVIQQTKRGNNLKLDSADKIDGLVNSVHTYRVDIKPYIEEDWTDDKKMAAIMQLDYNLRHYWVAGLEEVRRDLLDMAKAGVPAVDSIRRSALIFKKRAMYSRLLPAIKRPPNNDRFTL